MDVIDAIKGRASTRAFLDKAVSHETIHSILEVARWAPSGVNTQPWQVAVVAGERKRQISEAIIAKHNAGIVAAPDYQYYPTQWSALYKQRRFACGMALYEALDIKREDKSRRKEVWDMNYDFFAAPVGMFFFIDADLEQGSWLDMGMFIQNVMLAARGYGLETCPQAALAEYPAMVRELLSIDDSKHLICGMALGYADPEHIINQYRTERAEVDAFTQWYDL